jgi:hypothetical protein
MNYCTPSPPCDTEFPLLCEPLETTANGKRLVVEDSAACQKTIQTPASGQVLVSNTNGTISWTNGANNTLLRKTSSGGVEFATLNNILQANPVDLGSQPLTTTGAINATSVNATSVNATSVNATSVNATGVITGATAVFSVNSSSNAVRITQTGTGNALVIEDETSPDSSPTVIDTNGSLIVGNDTNLYGANIEMYKQDIGVSLLLKKSTNNSSSPSIAFIKSSGTTQNSNSLVSAGDFTGFISFQGTDGTAAKQSAAIAAVVDGFPSGSDMPGRLEFLTTPSGSTTPVERMRITNIGRVGIGTSNPAKLLHVNGTVRLQGLPTSATGLSAGDIWNDSGTLKIV